MINKAISRSDDAITTGTQSMCGTLMWPPVSGISATVTAIAYSACGSGGLFESVLLCLITLLIMHGIIMDDGPGKIFT